MLFEQTSLRQNIINREKLKLFLNKILGVLYLSVNDLLAIDYFLEC